MKGVYVPGLSYKINSNFIVNNPWVNRNSDSLSNSRYLTAPYYSFPAEVFVTPISYNQGKVTVLVTNGDYYEEKSRVDIGYGIVNERIYTDEHKGVSFTVEIDEQDFIQHASPLLSNKN